MQNLDELIAEYGESHTVKINVIIHKIFVPLIMFSVIGLLWAIPAPAVLTEKSVNWATIVTLLVMAYYLSLSVKYFLFMIPIIGGMYYGVSVMAEMTNVLWASVIIFIVSWVFQFIGHKYEGKKPSFFKDLLFLLIGPLWVAKSLFRLS
jgi:uncharacterized membrane protein YGL010W